MTDDKVYPASKPPAGIPASGNHAFPATKSQLYGANRPTYRPQPYHDRRRRRGCCCRCCIWTTLILLIIVLLIAGAGLAVYLIYRPQRPTFSVTSLKLSTLSLSSTSLTAAISVNVTAKNPNKRVTYDYSRTTVAVYTTDDVLVGEGSFPAFVHGKKNTTLLRSTIGGKKRELDLDSAGKLKADLKKKTLDLKMRLDTKVKVKMGALKTPKMAIRVTCEGIKVKPPAGKKPKATTASTDKVKCKVDPRVKIWRWTF